MLATQRISVANFVMVLHKTSRENNACFNKALRLLKKTHLHLVVNQFFPTVHALVFPTPTLFTVMLLQLVLVYHVAAVRAWHRPEHTLYFMYL